MKHSAFFIAAASVMAITVMACSKSDQIDTSQTATAENTTETTESATDEDKAYELYTEKKALCSELENMTYPFPPALEDMGTIIDMPDINAFTVETHPTMVTDVSDKLAESLIEDEFTSDTGMSGDMINDSWVISYTHGASVTVDEFRQKEKEYWQKQFNYAAHKRLQETILDKIMNVADIYLSPEMKDYGYKMECWSFIERTKASGKSIWDVINAYDDMGDIYSFEAECSIEGELLAEHTFILKQVAHDQGIVATDALVDQYAQEMSKERGREYTSAMLIEQYGLARAYEEAVNNAAMDYIESHVEVTEVPYETTAPEETEEPSIHAPWWSIGYDHSEAEQNTNGNQSYYGGVSDYNYTDDYDDPDDFAQEWADEYADDYDSYEDAMDDAYDIWDEEHGDD